MDRPKLIPVSGKNRDRSGTGFIGNLVGDVRDAAVGLPMGVVDIFTHNPVDTAKNIAGATWQTWSPLFHGHPLEFAESVYDHPLAPILDLATVFTLGAA